EGRAAAPSATASRGLRGRQGGEQLLAPLGGSCYRGAHGIGAQREEQMPVGIHEPPLAFDLFHAEEARGFGFRAFVTAIGSKRNHPFRAPSPQRPMRPVTAPDWSPCPANRHP